MKARLLGSLISGAFVAAIVTGYEGSYRHAALAAAAARNHQTVTFTLVWGFVGLALFVAVVVFVLDTVLGAPRRARRRDAALRAAVPAPRRRRRAAAGR